MQYRRNLLSFLAPMLLLGAMCALVGTVYADMIKENPMLEIEQLRSAAAKVQLRTNIDPTDGDTTWIGHVSGAVGTGAWWTANPAWSGYGPFHIGRGGYRIGSAVAQTTPANPAYNAAQSNNGYWDFEPSRWNAGETDTLMGWWSFSCPYASISGNVSPDRTKRWFFCFDYGNVGNHFGSDHGGKATFGVTSYWHVDAGSLAAPLPTNANTNPVALTWAPITGAGSAWCGLRSHGDVRFTDPVTGQPFNSSIVELLGDNHYRQVDAASTTFSDQNYPGYGSQWDQILYRDFNVTLDGSDLRLAFNYRTAMSQSKATDTNGNPNGYYNWDPIEPGPPAANSGNFISASDAGAALAPRDSFMVYVGVPVDDASWVAFSAGAAPPAKPVYAKQYRWFDEVIDYTQPARWLWSASGVSAGNTVVTCPAAIAANIKAVRGVIRVAFRVKTDRAYDDEDFSARGFSSGGQGAALLDDVTLGTVTTPGQFGPYGFESVGEINNALDANNNWVVPTTQTWKATGKPTASNWHWHNINAGKYTPVIYNDPCGAVGGAGRQCDMRGIVISAGNHDLAERMNGGIGAWDQEHQDFFMSPTINLRASGNGPGNYNEMGIDGEIADATNDIRLRWDIYARGFDLVNSGGGIRVAWESYPATQANGVKVWGFRKTATFSSYTNTLGCYGFANPAGATGKLSSLIKTTNANGVPDSVRALIERLSVCFRNATVVVCGSDQTDVYGGGYVDNITVGLVDGGAAPTLTQSGPWDLLQPAFPDEAGIDSKVGTAAFKNTTAWVKTGYNFASPTGNLARPVYPGDSMYVQAPGNSIRLDLVFRIQPGRGNYVNDTNKALGVTQTPGGAQALPGDGSFFGELLGDVGLYGTYKGGALPNGTGAGNVGPFTMQAVSNSTGNAIGAGEWDPNVFCSVRMDTLQKQFAAAQTGQYMSYAHETELWGNGVVPLADQDPDPATPRRGNWKPGAAPAAGLYRKILPDHLFTPGTHIEYFFRRTLLGNYSVFETMPDTNRIYTNSIIGWDGIRFAWYDVLPDLWKGPISGTPLQCMLVDNVGHRRGEGVVWHNMARAVGLTYPQKWGAGHGYWVGGGTDFPVNTSDVSVNPPTANGNVVRENQGSEGSLYDLYPVVAGESNVPSGRLGNRYALGGCPTPTGPTALMLRYYYANLVVLGADLGAGSVGPINDQTDDDIGLWSDFLNTASGYQGGSQTPRMLAMIGYDFFAGMNTYATTAGFLTGQLGTGAIGDDYRTDTANGNDFPDLNTIQVGTIGATPNPWTSSVYGFFNPCFLLTDYFQQPLGVGASVAATYDPAVTPTFHAAVFKPANIAGGRYGQTLAMGWTYGTFGGPGTLRAGLGQGGARFTIGRGGIHRMWLDIVLAMQANSSCLSLLQPIGVGDLQGQSGAPFVNFLNLRSENPWRSGSAKISFGIVRTEKVEVNIFDVSGRRVKTLANRVFEGGRTFDLTWDGTNEAGQNVTPGVYFYQLRSPSFTSQKKLTVLKN